MNLTYPIGVFDSGLGGLNVLRELRRVLPKEDYAYLADNKNSPYGIKSKEEIVALVREAIKFFEKLPVKLIVLACNTSSAYLGILQQETKLPVLGVILPTVRVALKSGKDLAVLATAATIDSGVYQNLLGEKKIPEEQKNCLFEMQRVCERHRKRPDELQGIKKIGPGKTWIADQARRFRSRLHAF